ncbi:unnamed protein product, partial [marine sediment metagenome]
MKASSIQLENLNNQPQIQMTGDPTVAVPVDGDFWWTGTALNFYDGATTHDLLAGGGATLELDVTQANTFSTGDWIYHDGSTYELADASAAATAESIGIVTAATGSDFTVQFGGRITGLSGLTAGEAHFLSET